ncbi:mitochondrial antiviral-signaling protein isoform X2 [Carettochelys insculpta]
MPPPAADPDPQHTGPTCQNNGHASPLARQAAGLPGSGASPPQAALWREESCQHLGDYNTPVQAVEQLSKQKVTEEAQTPGRKAPSSQPTGNAGLADVRASQDISNSGDGRVPAAIHLSPGSPVGGQLAGERALRREVERAEPGMPVSDQSRQGQDWAGCQQHPVCVSGGYFGNMNHLKVGNSRKVAVPGEHVQSMESAAAHSPGDCVNQPEEVYYSSFERSSLASSADRAVLRGRQQAGDSLQQEKDQDLQGYKHENPTSNTADVHNPLLWRTPSDEEQKHARGLRDQGQETDAFSLQRIRDPAQSPCSVGEAGVIKGRANFSPAVGSAPATQPRSSSPTELSEDATAHDTGVLPLGTTCSASFSKKTASRPSAGASQGTPEQNPGSSIWDPQSQVHSLAPATHKLHPASRSEPSNIHATSSSSHPTPASHNKVPKPSGTRPATEFSQVSGFSSTTAIPPSSPGLPSDPSGPAFTGDLGELKPPIQETKLPASSAARSTSLPKENANQMPKPLAPTVTRTSTETSGSTAWEEPDEELGLNKPGVLMSTAGREELASGEPDSAETNAPYSGNSKRFICSSSYSLGSNPLMISKSSTASSSIACSRDTQGNQPEENDYSSRSDHIPPALVASSGSGREGVVNTSRASLLPESCSSSWYSTAVETHEVHVVGYPNVDLGEAVAVRDGDCAYENPSPARSGPLRELSGYQRIKNNKARSPSNSETTPGDSPQKVNKPRPGSDGTSFPLKDYVLPAAITAFTSVVALLVYKYLRN